MLILQSPILIPLQNGILCVLCVSVLRHARRYAFTICGINVPYTSVSRILRPLYL